MNKTIVVITGGPSGGKTTLIEALQIHLSKKLTVIPEAASILYRGGLPRRKTDLARKHTQRAIFALQKELENWMIQESSHRLIVCDRGTLDSVAYWPGDETHFFKELQTNTQTEYSRYDWVIHLDTADGEDYDVTNPIRTENHFEALELNQKIKKAWEGHPRRVIIPHQTDFLTKIKMAQNVIEDILKSEGTTKSV